MFSNNNDKYISEIHIHTYTCINKIGNIEKCNISINKQNDGPRDKTLNMPEYQKSCQHNKM